MGDAFIGVPFEGILGLGSAKLSVAESSPIFDNMKNLNLIEKQIFAVYLANDNEFNGEITFGRIDTNYMMNNLIFFDVTSEDYWQVQLNDISLGNESLKVCDFILE